MDGGGGKAVGPISRTVTAPRVGFGGKEQLSEKHQGRNDQTVSFFSFVRSITARECEIGIECRP